MRKIPFYLPTVMTVTAIAAAASAAPVHFQNQVSPGAGFELPDTTLKQGDPSTNIGKSFLYVGSETTADRSILSIDLTAGGAIKPGDRIQSISLTLTKAGDSGNNTTSKKGWLYESDDTRRIELHALNRHFNENEATWNDATSGDPWNNPGGEFSSIVLAYFTEAAAPGEAETFGSSPDFVAAAQGALDHNNGVLNLIVIAPNAESIDNYRYVYFYSAEENAGNPSYRPLLTVTTVPEPAGLMLLGLCGLLARRR